MIDRPRIILIQGIVVLALLVVSVQAFAGWDSRAALDTLPDVSRLLPSHPQPDLQLREFEVSRLARGDVWLDANSTRIKAQSTTAIASLGGGARGTRGIPAQLRSIATNPEILTLRRELDGIPARDLDVTTSVRHPYAWFDPWEVEVYVDLAAIDRDAPHFQSPPTLVRFYLMPYGDPRAGVIDRWVVKNLAVIPGGMLQLAPDVSYVRRGDVGVLAATPDRALAETIADQAHAIEPQLRHDYRGLSSWNATFITLLPRRSDGMRVQEDWGEHTMDEATGVALDDRTVAIVAGDMRGAPSMLQREVVRHELTHLATQDITVGWYAGYIEGVAEWEGQHEITKSGEYYIKQQPVADRIRSGGVDLDAFLFEQDSFAKHGVARIDAYQLGAITIDYIEKTKGHAAAMRFYRGLAGGETPAEAVRSRLRMTPGAFREGVRGWVMSHPTWTG